VAGIGGMTCVVNGRAQSFLNTHGFAKQAFKRRNKCRNAWRMKAE
jgi:hypothetical protein